MYQSAFFYLVKRFGYPKNNPDSYKLASVWDFEVKDLTIRISITASNVEFIVFGKKEEHRKISPYWVAADRAFEKHKLECIDIHSNGKRPPLAEKAVANIEAKAKKEGIREENLLDYYMTAIWVYNNKVTGLPEMRDFNETYGEVYNNSYRKFCLKTLDQFLKNMLTPVSIRDCNYNILGACGCENDKFIGNVKINLLTPTFTQD